MKATTFVLIAWAVGKGTSVGVDVSVADRVIVGVGLDCNASEVAGNKVYVVGVDVIHGVTDGIRVALPEHELPPIIMNTANTIKGERFLSCIKSSIARRTTPWPP